MTSRPPACGFPSPPLPPSSPKPPNSAAPSSGCTPPASAWPTPNKAASSRLLLGTGYIANVPAAVWNYEVSGKQVLTQWFSYRRRNRERPIIGDRRPPSPLGHLQPDHWLSEYTTELIHLLHVLALLVDLEPPQAALLERILAGELISESEFNDTGALTGTASPAKSKTPDESTPDLFGGGT